MAKNWSRYHALPLAVKTCSSCGNVKKELKLSERTYKCDVCGQEQDRDLNASLNINCIGVEMLKRA